MLLTGQWPVTLIYLMPTSSLVYVWKFIPQLHVWSHAALRPIIFDSNVPFAVVTDLKLQSRDATTN